MPIRYVIDKERRLVLSTITGVLTYAEARAHQDKLLADPEFDRTYHQLIESLQAELIELSAEEIRTIATRSVFSPTSRRALVAVNPAFFGVGRMMQTYHQLTHTGTQVEVFRTVAEACRWLEV
ncbi:hypothetical protein Acid345_3086 [Candidatus Koribacter versatilis Ellin345]|uniref:STAS/SEC14 domain-containing protein n=1 Tax=Koribacter versatilis (strain Ellin345) TaxID=204669 RepID=Q1IM13_KORVE|nr:hypothetical protein [Candidatus Koribacter versatilis]ABF42087.1 hypothetical protein Acid345_3086 [Candidatus Koribacter versatilis Ellin345]